MSLYKESMLNKIEDDLQGRNQNWDELETHLAENANKAHGGFKGALLRKTQHQSVTSTLTPLVWQVVDYDTNNFFSSTNPTRLTIPSGVSKVKLIANIRILTSGNIDFTIQKNGTFYQGNPYLIHEGIRFNLSSAVVEVSEGDYFEVYVSIANGGEVRADTATWFALEVVE